MKSQIQKFSDSDKNFTFFPTGYGLLMMNLNGLLMMNQIKVTRVKKITFD